MKWRIAKKRFNEVLTRSKLHVSRKDRHVRRMAPILYRRVQRNMPSMCDEVSLADVASYLKRKWPLRKKTTIYAIT
jgi:hypothetical protein